MSGASVGYEYDLLTVGVRGLERTGPHRADAAPREPLAAAAVRRCLDPRVRRRIVHGPFGPLAGFAGADPAWRFILFYRARRASVYVSHSPHAMPGEELLDPHGAEDPAEAAVATAFALPGGGPRSRLRDEKFLGYNLPFVLHRAGRRLPPCDAASLFGGLLRPGRPPAVVLVPFNPAGAADRAVAAALALAGAAEFVRWAADRAGRGGAR